MPSELDNPYSSMNASNLVRLFLLLLQYAMMDCVFLEISGSSKKCDSLIKNLANSCSSENLSLLLENHRFILVGFGLSSFCIS